MMKLENIVDLKSTGESLEGSIPSGPTTFLQRILQLQSLDAWRYEFYFTVRQINGCLHHITKPNAHNRTRVIRGGRSGSSINLSRVAYQLAHLDKDITNLYVCHTCDNPRCVEVTHLFAGTAKDNSIDMTVKGRANKTTYKRRESILIDKLYEIRELRKTKSYAEIGKLYGVSHQVIMRLLNGRP